MKSFAGMISSSFEANMKNVQNGSVKRVRIFRENGVYVSLVLYFLRSLEHCLTVIYVTQDRVTAVKLTQEDRKILESIARKYGISLSDVLRIAIREFISKNEIKIREVRS
jgi:hypothetical protein